VFRPLVRRRHVRLAEWACFAFSGAIHELAISVPAGAGYGLPFAYFMWQGVGVWLERRSPASMRGGVFGWCYTALFTIPAAYWLFHPAFVRRLILPLIGG
jgi:alginate O-acetyltransferase complex protein AlgI